MPSIAAHPTATSAELRQLVGQRPLVEITPAAEQAWRMHRHGLIGSPGAGDVIGLARVHCGLHAARQLTPWVTVHARYPTAEPGLLRRALAQRRLLRLRCMRRTLHLVPLDLAQVAHTATLRQRVRPCQLALARSGLGRQSQLALRRRASALLQDRELGYRQLERELMASAPGPVRRRVDAVALVRLVIKLMWEEGELVVGDASASLHHEQRTFALASEAVPSVVFDDRPTPDAATTLLRSYLQGYGPTTIVDFHWWSGLGIAEAMHAWREMEQELVRVHIGDHPSEELVALATTIDELERIPAPPPEDAARVLAYEDPALKGYFRSRWRYVDPQHQRRLFNSIGEARASVMLGGRIAAVWRWNRRSQTTELERLRSFSRAESSTVDNALARVAAFLRAEPLLTG